MNTRPIARRQETGTGPANGRSPANGQSPMADQSPMDDQSPAADRYWRIRTILEFARFVIWVGIQVVWETVLRG
ncbi:hypothetical protein [Spirillospora sp. NPDC047279]|uniref:hypothetical protein n=1 Tax=Spirillospora sp. NPDC047279 TaxID=3155478 RepID=UPI0033EBD74C